MTTPPHSVAVNAPTLKWMRNHLIWQLARNEGLFLSGNGAEKASEFLRDPEAKEKNRPLIGYTKWLDGGHGDPPVGVMPFNWGRVLGAIDDIERSGIWRRFVPKTPKRARVSEDPEEDPSDESSDESSDDSSDDDDDWDPPTKATPKVPCYRRRPDAQPRHGSTTYGQKHLLERWRHALYPEGHAYLTNGEFALAVSLMGYELWQVDDTSPNMWLDARIDESGLRALERVARRVRERLYRDSATFFEYSDAEYTGAGFAPLLNPRDIL